MWLYKSVSTEYMCPILFPRRFRPHFRQNWQIFETFDLPRALQRAHYNSRRLNALGQILILVLAAMCCQRQTERRSAQPYQTRQYSASIA